MPIQECQSNGQSGFKWGASGTCYTHDGSDAGKARAKQKAVKQAIAAGATPREFEELPTVDLEGVEIMSTGGPVRGIGSPIEGDHYSADFLRNLADAARELGDELKPPAKIGHSDKQALALSGAREGLTKGELPAVGWLDNLRVSADGSKLLADVRSVPRRFASLIQAGAYRTRSSELKPYTSQRTGRRYPAVVSGLAWLGGSIPAIQTLGDVFRLYEGDDDEPRFLQLDETPAPDLDGLRDAIAADSVERALSATEEIRRRAESSPMELTDDKVKELAAAVGAEEGAEIDKVIEAAAARGTELETTRTELEAAKTKAEELEARKNEGDERLTELEKKAEAGERAEKRLFEMERDQAVDAAVKDGRVDPADREKWQKRYENDADLTKEILSELKPDQDLVRELGSDDGDPEDLEDEQYERSFESRFGHKPGAAV